MLKVSVALSDSTIIVRMTGKLGPNDSSTVFSFVREVLIGRYQRLFVDLSECRDMDSTFMGLLLLIYEKHTEENGSEFCLLNVGEENRKALKMLGLEKMVPMKDLSLKEAPEFTEVSLNGFRKERRDKIEFIEIAHRALANASAQNAEKFGSFLRLLEEEKNETQNEE